MAATKTTSENVTFFSRKQQDALRTDRKFIEFFSTILHGGSRHLPAQS